jgi:hypothetical protein
MTPDEAFAAGYAEGLARPLAQDAADRVAAILAPYRHLLARERQAA